MPRQYSSSMRRQIVARLRSGERVAAVAVDTGICEATLFRWKREALIDAGVIDGTPRVGADELAAAHKRIAQLEAELVLPAMRASCSTRRRWCPKTPSRDH
ncbi:transposase [Mycolicibacterium sp. YH-1]|uniref:transposase n=1 Tax=Mycolicibacterium sp. YH-1 TaxID=2908837 RepID=UPI001F4C49AC|nr:transposase [Mycolicibacterium sp. YH-1]UNB52959.1 transposase [Mycolicibacterium sp. YH-1]